MDCLKLPEREKSGADESPASLICFSYIILYCYMIY
jgi:hypothetical protein